MQGMTGYGRSQGAESWGAWVWEMRSVNGRSLDARVSTPAGLDAVEFEVRKRLKERFSRGSFQASLRVDLDQEDGETRVDPRELRRLAALSRRWASAGLAPARVTDALGVRDGGRRRGGSALGEDEAAVAVLLAGADVALAGLAAARDEEGRALAQMLGGIVTELQAAVRHAVEHASPQPGLIAQRFRERVAELERGGPPVDADRIAQEAAVLAAKGDVREELDRLVAHIDAARGLLISKEPVGRKLDFLCQEFNREANTLCSKSASLELTSAGLAIKSLIDQFREQSQNVE
ncbi:YicC family protein [bacterium]|nr:YicC family protein [bacterium]